MSKELNENNESTIHDFILWHRDRLKSSLPIISLTEERNSYIIDKNNRLFVDDIDEQYEEQIKFEIANDICRNLALDYETVFVVVDDLNIKEYLK